jgi:hypothetical protein
VDLQCLTSSKNNISTILSDIDLPVNWGRLKPNAFNCRDQKLPWEAEIFPAGPEFSQML